MVYAHHVYTDLISLYILNPHHILQHQCQQFLGAEDLMTASEGFDFRENPVQRPDCLLYTSRCV